MMQSVSNQALQGTSNSRGNVLFALAGLLTVVILMFWLIPQFLYHTVYIYFRSIDQMQVANLDSYIELSENTSRGLLQIFNGESFEDVINTDRSELKLKCDQSAELRKELQLPVELIEAQTFNKPVLWAPITAQIKHSNQFMFLSALNHNCRTLVDHGFAEDSLLFETIRSIDFFRQQSKSSKLHLRAQSYLSIPAQLKLNLLKEMQNSPLWKQKSAQFNQSQWKNWLASEKNSLIGFLRFTEGAWIPYELYQSYKRRKKRWLGLFEEVKFKELLSSLEYRKQIYATSFKQLRQRIEVDRYDIQKFEVNKSQLIEALKQKFQSELVTSPGQRFLDFLIAPRSWNRRVKHQCFQGLYHDLHQEIFSSIEFQLKLIARIEYALDSIAQQTGS